MTMIEPPFKRCSRCGKVFYRSSVQSWETGECSDCRQPPNETEVLRDLLTRARVFVQVACLWEDEDEEAHVLLAEINKHLGE